MTSSTEKNNSNPISINSGELGTDIIRAKTSVERAISDLRRGALILLFDPLKRTAAIIQAAELTTAKGLELISQLAGSEPSVVITNRRSAAIRLNTETRQVISVSIPSQGGIELVHRLANPIFESQGGFDPINQKELDNLPVVPEAIDGLAPKAVQLVKFARLLPSVILSRIPYAEMTRLSGWSKSDSLLAVDARLIDSLPEMRAQRLVKAVSAQVPLIDSEETRLIAFRPVDGGEEHVAIVIGDPDVTQGVLVRLHSQCLTGDLLGSLRCDCGDQLRGAIKAISEYGGGVVVYLAQEGRDIGLVNKLRAYNLQDLGSDTVEANHQIGFEVDERIYAPAAEILKQLGIKKVKLLTNNPNKIDQLASTGIEVVERVKHAFPPNPHNREYLKTKAAKTGHLF
ncbi:MAG: GTP cyclohydrolase II [Pseudomonadota bacterium]|nr:GTP cyclohydrolase II [Pseudomonadota bacterium]